MRTVFTKLALFGSRGWRFLGSKHLADAPNEPRKALASNGRKILVAYPSEIFSSDSRYFKAMR